LIVYICPFQSVHVVANSVDIVGYVVDDDDVAIANFGVRALATIVVDFAFC
jgi:hypothetical protein